MLDRQLKFDKKNESLHNQKTRIVFFIFFIDVSKMTLKSMKKNRSWIMWYETSISRNQIDKKFNVFMNITLTFIRELKFINLKKITFANAKWVLIAIAFVIFHDFFLNLFFLFLFFLFWRCLLLFFRRFFLSIFFLSTTIFKWKCKTWHFTSMW